MEIDFLHHYDFSPPIIAALQTSYGRHFLPLQERVIKEGQLFENKNLLICAPTSSGKTFLSELLFLHHASQGRNAILLVPTKSLANQRFRQLKNRYQELGFDILLSTRDHPFQDHRIIAGRFHLAIVIYEKMRMFLSHTNFSLSSVGACLIDEIHYLYHPTRGPDLEILLTRLLDEKNIQLLGLSAMVADPQVAGWLRARMIVEKQRPVELRQGVLCKGVFQFRELNTGRDGQEQLFESDAQDEGEAMLEAARFFASRQETTLLFWPQRDLCYTAARKLAQLYKPEKKENIPDLQFFEPSSMRDFLAELLPRRIAVHTSDLTFDERELVEKLVKKGGVDLICSTSTLAEGMNFPVSNVLTTKRMYSRNPDDIQSGRPPSALPIPKDQLWNMLGRAGRLGLSEFGRGIVVTTSQGDVEGLLNRYIRSNPAPLAPLLPQLPLQQGILRAMSYHRVFTVERCCQTFRKTLSGCLSLLSEQMDEEIRSTCETLAKQGYLADEFGTYHPTPLGEMVMQSGLSDPSAQRLLLYAKTLQTCDIFPLDIITLICTLQEIQDIYLPVSLQDIRSHAWSRAIHQKADDDGIHAELYLGSLLSEPSQLRKEHHSAFKKALLLNDWIQGCSTPVIEKRYALYAGMIHRLAEDVSWLLGCLIDVAASHAIEEKRIRQLILLQDRIRTGIPEKNVAWNACILNHVLTRDNVLLLSQAGFDTPQSISSKDKKLLLSFLPEQKVGQLLAYQQHIREPKDSSAPYVLILNEKIPNRIQLEGIDIPLTTLQYRLISTLADQAGSCVPYEILLERVWPDSMGDKKQLSRQKNILLKSLEKKTQQPFHALIETIAGVGMVLHARIEREH